MVGTAVKNRNYVHGVLDDINAKLETETNPFKIRNLYEQKKPYLKEEQSRRMAERMTGGKKSATQAESIKGGSDRVFRGITMD